MNDLPSRKSWTSRYRRLLPLTFIAHIDDHPVKSRRRARASVQHRISDCPRFHQMTSILVVLIAAFVALSIWFSVRIVNRPGTRANRAGVGLFILVVAYPASVGPVCWWVATPEGPYDPPRLPVVYWPLGKLAANGPDLIYQPVCWWMGLGVRHGRSVWVPTNLSNSEWVGIRK